MWPVDRDDRFVMANKRVVKMCNNPKVKEENLRRSTQTAIYKPCVF